MYRTRVIPCLLLQRTGLVKTINFKNPTYLGDPINIVKIFNDKEVDELVLLDICATSENKRPQFELIEKIASECFMPLGYGGGIRNIEDMKTLFGLGVEKISINSGAVESPDLIKKAADQFGSQSVVVSIDVKKSWLGKYEVVTHAGKKRTGLDPKAFAVQMERAGAGELLLNSVDRDGTMQGYDLKLIAQVTEAVSIPVIVCGGAGKLEDFSEAVMKGGASAAGAGSFFVFKGPHRAVLISYPTSVELKKIFEN
ncbi:MAG: imidazole glycerol phosphate synthase subunit HisF [Acidobacteria bacterium]|nr:imidazole glycerol phosphate synthase subunit HisF [Acidobacteriota bacterium]